MLEATTHVQGIPMVWEVAVTLRKAGAIASVETTRVKMEELGELLKMMVNLKGTVNQEVVVRPEAVVISLD